MWSKILKMKQEREEEEIDNLTINIQNMTVNIHSSPPPSPVYSQYTPRRDSRSRSPRRDEAESTFPARKYSDYEDEVAEKTSICEKMKKKLTDLDKKMEAERDRLQRLQELREEHEERERRSRMPHTEPTYSPTDHDDEEEDNYFMNQRYLKIMRECGVKESIDEFRQGSDGLLFCMNEIFAKEGLPPLKR